MVIRDEVTNAIHIKCEVCDTVAPPASEILKAHGLNRMGWHCLGGTHFCPEHNPTTSSKEISQ